MKKFALVTILLVTTLAFTGCQRIFGSGRQYNGRYPTQPTFEEDRTLEQQRRLEQEPFPEDPAETPRQPSPYGFDGAAPEQDTQEPAPDAREFGTYEHRYRGDDQQTQQRRGENGVIPRVPDGDILSDVPQRRRDRQAQKVDFTVEMTNDNRYDPEDLTITTGQTVKWRNTSATVHTVTADDRMARDQANAQVPPGAEPFNSGAIAPGEVFAYTFTVPGSYVYFCIPHETVGMVGRLEVIGSDIMDENLAF